MTEFEPISVSRIHQIISLIDLTNLNDNCDSAAIETLCAQASTSAGNVAALCIWPSFVLEAKNCLGEKSPIKIATVANFPNGDYEVDATCDLIESALKDGADEIDYVLPYSQLMGGNNNRVSDEIKIIRSYIPVSVKLKVILETGILENSKHICTAANIAIDQGADFIKTSTGKVPINATLEAAEVMLDVIKSSQYNVGFKAAGGIQTVEDAHVYLTLAEKILGQNWADSTHFRFGASSLLHDALNKLDITSSPKPSNSNDY